jgi:O-antigen/teichoic acid export membrane protein
MQLSIKALLSGQTSVRLNLSANLVSKILGTVVSLAVVPTYIRVLGVAGYGVIGIWATLETLTKLFDLGISPTMTRELAVGVRRTEETQHVRDLVRTLEVIFWTLGVLIGAAMVLGAPLIATRWLRSSQLSAGQLCASLQLIGILIFCRWPQSFYASGLTGLERQVLQSWMEFFLTIVRSVGAVVVLVFVSPTIFAFLVWQIAINVVGTALGAAALWWSLPAGRAPRFRPNLLTQVWRFAGGVTAIALVSMLLNDLDKLVVSGFVSLEDFGYYTLASRMAGMLYLIASSIFAAVYPAFVRLATEQNEVRLAEFYHRSAQTLSLLIFPTAITAAFFANPLIFAWTGNPQIADHAAVIAALLIIGTAFHCTEFLPYAAQLAHRWTSLAFWINLAYVPVTTALLVMFTRKFGGVGAAIVWLLIATSYYATQIPLMHRKILKFQAQQWYVHDVGIPLIACSLTAGLLAATLEPVTTRFGAVLTVIVAGLLVGVAGLLASPRVRIELHAQWLQFRA